MQSVYTRLDLPSTRQTICERLRSGQIALLPTDTIYGISGNALDDAVVDRILKLKARSQPPSLIPHAFDWARSLLREPHAQDFDAAIARFSGPFTILWPYDSRSAQLPAAMTSSGLVGVRWPHHWVRDLAIRSGVPLVTTSANVSGEPSMTSLDDVSEVVRAGVDFIVYQGPLPGPPSTIVDLSVSPPGFTERQ